jgi:hypothetical protein
MTPSELVVKVRYPFSHGNNHVHFRHSHSLRMTFLHGFHPPNHIRPIGHRKGDREKTCAQHTAAGRIHIVSPEINQSFHRARLDVRLILGRRESSLGMCDGAMQSAGQGFQDQRPHSLLRHMALEPLVNGRLAVIEECSALRTYAIHVLGELAQRPPGLAVQPLKTGVRFRRVH